MTCDFKGTCTHTHSNTCTHRQAQGKCRCKHVSKITKVNITTDFSCIRLNTVKYVEMHRLYTGGETKSRQL